MDSFITFIRNLFNYIVGTQIGKSLIVGFFIFILILFGMSKDDSDNKQNKKDN